MQIRTNAGAVIPTSIKTTEVGDNHAVAFDKDGQLFIMTSTEKGGPNV